MCQYDTARGAWRSDRHAVDEVRPVNPQRSTVRCQSNNQKQSRRACNMPVGFEMYIECTASAATIGR